MVNIVITYINNKINAIFLSEMFTKSDWAINTTIPNEY